MAARQKPAKKARTSWNIDTQMLQSCIGALLEALMRWFIRSSKLNGKTKGCKENNVRVKGAMAASSSWNQQLEGKQNAENAVPSLLDNSFNLKIYFAELCKEGVWVVSIQDIGSSCFCPTPSFAPQHRPAPSSAHLTCHAMPRKYYVPTFASQNQARYS